MRKLAGILLFCVLTLAACGTTSAAASPTATDTPAPAATTAPTATPATPAPSGAATISFARISFASGSVTIKAGQAVTFSDPASSGGTHILVIGHEGQFSAVSGAPSELNSSGGTTFAPGDTKTITFPTAGTYPITCVVHPSMEVTVTVTA